MTTVGVADPSRWLEMIATCRADELHRPPSGDNDAAIDVGRRQRIAGLVAAYHGGAAQPGPASMFVFGWRRQRADGPIDVYAGGAALGATRPDGTVVLNIPAGGRGRWLPPGCLIEALRIMPWWTRVAGITDGLLVDGTAAAQPHSLRPSIAA